MSDAENEARAIGWRPKEEFRGDPDKWVDAETFVDRGRHFLPILRSNNAKLEEANRKLSEELVGIKSLLSASQDSIKALTEFQTAETKRQVTEVKKQLVERLREVRESGNVEQEAALLDELADIRSVEKSQKEASEKAPTPAPPPKQAADADPALQAWMSKPENSWFGRDTRRTALAVAIGQELRNDAANNKLVGEAFFDKVAQEVEAVFSPTTENRSSKVEGSASRGGGGGGGGAGKGYASLPNDAKQACNDMARRMVGEGRAFKTNADWQTHYASVYFSQGE